MSLYRQKLPNKSLTYINYPAHCRGKIASSCQGFVCVAPRQWQSRFPTEKGDPHENSYPRRIAYGRRLATRLGGGRNEPIQPIQPAKQINLGMVELGKKLYFDPRLSKSGFISCNSCHNLSMGGTDNIPTSIGDHWQQGPINAPTVLNSSLNVAQFWDGRAADLKAQAGGPIANPGEMAFTHTLALGVLESIPAYVREFKTGLRQGQDRHRPGDPGHRRVREDPGDAEFPLRSMAAGQEGRADRRRTGRLQAVQGQRLRRLPQWPGRRRQLVPEDGRGRALQGHAARPRAAPPSPARMPTASTSRCRPCATWK